MTQQVSGGSSKSDGAMLLGPRLMLLGALSGKPPVSLARPLTLVGSRQNAHVRLLSRSVSKAHAILVQTEGRFYIRDLASRTHVYVNGEQVREADLKDGDQIQIGSFTFRFRWEKQTKPLRKRREPVAAMLEVGDGSQQGPCAVDQRVLLIGRRPGSALVLPEASVSTAHAVIFQMNGKRYVRDLGSRTGTFVNGSQVHQLELSLDDVIRIGETELRYVMATAEEGAEPGVLDLGVSGTGMAAMEEMAAVAERLAAEQHAGEVLPMDAAAPADATSAPSDAAPASEDEEGSPLGDALAAATTQLADVMPADAEPTLTEELASQAAADEQILIDLDTDPDVSGSAETLPMPNAWRPQPIQPVVLSKLIVDSADESEPTAARLDSAMAEPEKPLPQTPAESVLASEPAGPTAEESQAPAAADDEESTESLDLTVNGRRGWRGWSAVETTEDAPAAVSGPQGTATSGEVPAEAESAPTGAASTEGSAPSPIATAEATAAAGEPSEEPAVAPVVAAPIEPAEEPVIDALPVPGPVQAAADEQEPPAGDLVVPAPAHDEVMLQDDAPGEVLVPEVPSTDVAPADTDVAAELPVAPQMPVAEALPADVQEVAPQPEPLPVLVALEPADNTPQTEEMEPSQAAEAVAAVPDAASIAPVESGADAGVAELALDAPPQADVTEQIAAIDEAANPSDAVSPAPALAEVPPVPPAPLAEPLPGAQRFGDDPSERQSQPAGIGATDEPELAPASAEATADRSLDAFLLWTAANQSSFLGGVPLALDPLPATDGSDAMDGLAVAQDASSLTVAAPPPGSGLLGSPEDAFSAIDAPAPPPPSDALLLPDAPSERATPAELEPTLESPTSGSGEPAGAAKPPVRPADGRRSQEDDSPEVDDDEAVADAFQLRSVVPGIGGDASAGGDEEVVTEFDGLALASGPAGDADVFSRLFGGAPSAPTPTGDGHSPSRSEADAPPAEVQDPQAATVDAPPPAAGAAQAAPENDVEPDQAPLPQAPAGPMASAPAIPAGRTSSQEPPPADAENAAEHRPMREMVEAIGPREEIARLMRPGFRAEDADGSRQALAVAALQASGDGLRRRRRWFTLPVLLVLMLLCMAAAAAAIYLLVGRTAIVEATLIFDNYKSLTQKEKVDLAGEQKRLLLESETLRRSALEVLRSRYPQRSPGFLGDTVPYFRATNAAEIGLLQIAPDTFAYALRLETPDEAGDRERLHALFAALYQENAQWLGTAEPARKRIEELEDLIAGTRQRIAECQDQIAQANSAIERRPTPQRMQALQAEESRRRKELDAGIAAVSTARVELDAARGASTQPQTGSPDPAAEQVLASDPDLVRMQGDLRKLSQQLAEARSPQAAQAQAARKTLDTSLEQFQQQVAAVQSQMKDNPQLSAYVAAAQALQEGTRELTDGLIEDQQSQQQWLSELKQRLDQQLEAKRLEVWEKDGTLQTLNEQLGLATRKYNAAVSGGKDLAKEAARWKGEVETITRQIETRKAAVGTDKFYAEAIAQLQQFIDASQARLEKNRKQVEAKLSLLQKNFTQSQPALDKLPRSQKAMAAELQKRWEAISEARRQYATVMDAQAIQASGDLQRLGKEVAALQEKIEARKWVLGSDVARQRQLDQTRRDKEIEQRQARLAEARAAEEKARLAWQQASVELVRAQTAVQEADAAAGRVADAQTKLVELQQHLTAQGEELETSQRRMARVVVPLMPELKDVRTIAQLEDLRGRYTAGAFAAIVLLFSGLFMASHWLTHREQRQPPIASLARSAEAAAQDAEQQPTAV